MQWPKFFPRAGKEKSKSELLYEQYEFEKRERAKMVDRLIIDTMDQLPAQTVASTVKSNSLTFQDIVGMLGDQSEPKPHAVTELPLDTDTAISGAAPQIIKQKPKDEFQAIPIPEPKSVPLDSHGNVSPAFPKSQLIGVHSYPPTNKVPDKDKWGKIIADLEDHYLKTGQYKNIVEEDDDGNWVPASISSSYSPWAGKFQPSLKPNSSPTPVTPIFSTWVSIGNPNNGGIRLNCIENSRGEFIYFKDNREIVKQAVENFNRDYATESRIKTVLCGSSEEDYVNFSLTFKSLSYEDQTISVNFERYEFVTGHGSGITNKLINAIDCIKNSCQFYLQGEIDLDEETESKIVSMKISTVSYINPNRMKNGEIFVYL